jgi:G3E family GTPase
LEESDNVAAIQNVLDAIKVINATAPTKLTTYSSITDLHWVLDTQCFDPERVQELDATYEQLTQRRCDGLQCICSQQLCGLCNTVSNNFLPAPQHRHTSAISTISLFNIGSVDLHKLNVWLASILWPNQDEKDSVLRARLETTAANDSTNEVGIVDQQCIYRIKGVISIQHSKIPNDYNDEDSIKYICSSTNLDRRRYIVQAVNDLWDVTPASDQLCWNEEETRCCKLVVIGKWLDEDRLRREFEECFCAS